METIMISDMFQIKCDAEITYNDFLVLTKLYMPIIGKNAYSLYMALQAESDLSNVFSTFFSIGRLMNITDLTLDQLKEGFRVLEGIRLISTYVKYKDVNQFIFVVHSPVSAKQFFNNQIYNVLLYRTLKKDDYEKTKYTFQTKSVNLKEYEEVSSKFDDAFYFNYNSYEGSEALEMNNIRDLSKVEVESNYDYDLFFKELSHLQIRRDTFSKEELKTIGQYGMIYSIDGIQLANLAIESLENGHLNLNTLAEKIRKYDALDTNKKLQAVYRRQSYDLRTNSKSNDSRSNKIRQMEEMTPYELLEARQQSTPLNRDLQIIETCMIDIGLNPGVMNVLLELTWALNDGKMPKRYMETIASSWQRQGIRTVEDAMKEATKIMKQKKSIQSLDQVEVKRTADSKQDSDEYTQAKLQELLAKAGGNNGR